MQPLCTEQMKIARDLLDYGVLDEGAEQLSRLHNCGQRTGCDRWQNCLCLVERQWRFSKDVPTARR